MFPLSRLLAVFCILAPAFLCAQETPADPASGPKATPPAVEAIPSNVAPALDKRIFGVLPNYRTAEDTGVYQPLTRKQKFRIAYKDSFDWPVYMTSGAFAALYQLEDSNPSFGQGLEGYAKRYATSYADQCLGNILTEGIFPSLLHEDPRYFRHPDGSKKSRAAYAASRIFVTRTDSGGKRFNYSEVVGNSIATGLSNLYYPESRTFSDNIQKLGVQLATDAFSNILKEFWPDIKRKWFKKDEGR